MEIRANANPLSTNHGQRRSSLKQDDVGEHYRQSRAAGDCQSVKGHYEADRITKPQLATMTFKPMLGFTAPERSSIWVHGRSKRLPWVVTESVTTRNRLAL